MIVVGIIAIISAIAIPNLIKARMTATEGAAVGNLDTVVKAQAVFQVSNDLDQDTDGVGEYGVMRELAGETTLRLGPDPLEQPPLTAVFRPATNTAKKSGYWFRCYVPGSDDNRLSAAVAGDHDLGPGDPDTTDLQEVHFVLYAWPVRRGRTGVTCYAVSEQLDKYYSNAVSVRYNGTDDAPFAHAFFSTGSATFADGIGGTGNDGNVWAPIGNQ